jgi:hypothetical protein
VNPTWFGVVERTIQITTQTFRVQAGLRTRERQAELVKVFRLMQFTPELLPY